MPITQNAFRVLSETVERIRQLDPGRGLPSFSLDGGTADAEFVYVYRSGETIHCSATPIDGFGARELTSHQIIGWLIYANHSTPFDGYLCEHEDEDEDEVCSVHNAGLVTRFISEELYRSLGMEVVWDTSDGVMCMEHGEWSCSGCGDYFYLHDRAPTYDSHGSWCHNCYEEETGATRASTMCPQCGNSYNGDGQSIPTGGGRRAVVCSSCYLNHARRNQGRIERDTRSIASVECAVEDRGNPWTFGVEIELASSAFPFNLGGYHSLTEGQAPLLRRWRAEADSSVRGGEVISPVLRGVKGVGEVLATFQIIEEVDGAVGSSCGQHVHIGSDERPVTADAWRAQIVGALLEDFLIASTGSWSRWHNGYAAKFKADCLDHLRNWLNRSRDLTQEQIPSLGAVDGGSRSVVGVTGFNTLEFRYPPGTLVDTQFIINLGLIMLTMDLSRDDETVEFSRAQVEEMIGRGNSRSIGAAARGRVVHQSVCAGAMAISNQGWRIGGEWKGLPYNPAGELAPLKVVDEERDQEIEVTLPSEDEILRRLKRQVRGFYRRASQAQDWWTKEEGKAKADEVVALMA